MIKEYGIFYEEKMLADIRSRLKPGANVIDVGAYIGNHSIYLASFCDANVTAFEPSMSAYNTLVANIQENNLENKIKPINIALGSQKGRGELTTPSKTNIGRTILSENPQGPVEISTLDEQEVQNVDLIKIDVEGMEEAVLSGASKTIERFKPLIYVEIIEDEERDRIDELLSKFGYARKTVFGGTPTYLYDIEYN